MVLLAIFRDDKSRLFLLLVASYVFYGAWNPAYLALIFGCTLSGWLFGFLIHNAQDKQTKRVYFITSISISLGLLGYFKYATFFAENIHLIIGGDSTFEKVLLPVGISFFTFQTMSYTIDVYRGNLELCRSLPKFMLFVAFFPQLVAGPIVRASEFLPQLNRSIKITPDNCIIGAQIFLGGAIQKVLFADTLSTFVDPVFDNPLLYSSETLWLALIAYSIQIFCDFSGYSLMAIGVARALGFELPPNFKMPYISISITEFWRRWHLTLSFWLRDYLYISLGGNRKGELQTKINLMITMLLGGLWHGASWNFVLWGALHGFGLVVHKYWTGWQHAFKETTVYRYVAWLVTLIYVMLLWVPFRSSDFSTTIIFYQGLFSGGLGVDWMHTQSIFVVLTVAVWHVLYLRKNELLVGFPYQKPHRYIHLYPIVTALMLILLFAPTNSSPFIYFQF